MHILLESKAHLSAGVIQQDLRGLQKISCISSKQIILTDHKIQLPSLFDTSSAVLQCRLQNKKHRFFNIKPVLQTGGMEFKRHGHLHD